jgi:hypothetical protein
MPDTSPASPSPAGDHDTPPVPRASLLRAAPPARTTRPGASMKLGLHPEYRPVVFRDRTATHPRHRGSGSGLSQAVRHPLACQGPALSARTPSPGPRPAGADATTAVGCTGQPGMRGAVCLRRQKSSSKATSPHAPGELSCPPETVPELPGMVCAALGTMVANADSRTGSSTQPISGLTGRRASLSMSFGLTRRDAGCAELAAMPGRDQSTARHGSGGSQNGSVAAQRDCIRPLPHQTIHLNRSRSALAAGSTLDIESTTPVTCIDVLQG